MHTSRVNLEIRELGWSIMDLLHLLQQHCAGVFIVIWMCSRGLMRWEIGRVEMGRLIYRHRASECLRLCACAFLKEMILSHIMNVCLLRTAVCTKGEVGLTLFRWECTREGYWCWTRWGRKVAGWCDFMPFITPEVRCYAGSSSLDLNVNSKSFSTLQGCSQDLEILMPWVQVSSKND